MRNKIVKALLKKEFLNIIRDRKTFITMILLPLLMFPLMIGIMTIMLSLFTSIDDKLTFGVNYEITEDFKEYIDNYSENYNIEVIYDTEENLKNMFDEEDISIYVIKEDNNYTLHYDANNTNNVASSTIIENLYSDYKEEYIKDELEKVNINYEEISFNVLFEQESVTEMGSLVPSIIAMVLIMIISSVCFSVAIDVTTSEKEKGTLETLLSLPIKKSELITSKYITVFVLSCMSGFLAYLSLFTTLYFAKNTLVLLGVNSLTIDFKLLMIFLISIILLSLLFSGLLLSVTIFSKNLKDAQNSLYPLEIMSTFISMLPMFGIQAQMKYSIIPFVNISLLFNNALASNIDPLFVVITFVSSFVYALLAILIVSKIYNSEEVLFNTEKLNYLVVKNGKIKTDAFSPFSAIIIAIIVLLLSMYFSIIFISSSKYILMSVMPITIALVVLVSGILVKLDVKKSFKINSFSLKRLGVTFMLYISTYILAEVVLNIFVKVFPSATNVFSSITDLVSIDNIWLALLIVALLPAIFEEILFRGVICTSFNKKWGSFVAIFFSALLFGIYHMNWIQGIFAFLLGLVLGYSYLKSNSIIVPFIIHYTNNALAVLDDHYGIFDFILPKGINVYLVVSALILLILAIYISEFYVKEKDNS